MIYLGERDPRVSVHGDRIEISALYGRDINLSNISEITLIEKSMWDIGTGQRTNGYGSGSPALKGYFNSVEHGQQVLFVYANSAPTIKITQTLGTVIYISFRDSETTRATYQMLSSIPLPVEDGINHHPAL